MKLKIFGLLAAVAVTLTLGSVAYAGEIDLTQAGTTATVNGAYFSNVNPQPTGTGNIDPFEQVTGNASSLSAYNTTVNNVLNNGSADNWNHQLPISELIATTTDCPGAAQGSNGCFEFSLDINQSKDSPLLSLDNVEVFLSNTPNQSTTNISSLGTLIYNMDGSGDQEVILDYLLNNGSGSGDMNLFIPVFDTTGYNYVYLYSAFGGLSSCGPYTVENGNTYSTCTENDGFEEWYVSGTQGAPFPQVPEPGSLMLFGTGLLGMAGYMRRRLLG